MNNLKSQVLNDKDFKAKIPMIDIAKKKGDSYFPDNPEGKISVKYYLNTDLKPKISESGEALYQLYYKVTVKKQATKGKSLAKNSLMSATYFAKIEKILNSQNMNDLIQRLTEFENSPEFEYQDESYDMEYSVSDEKRFLLKIVDRLNPFNRKDFDIREVIENYELFNIKISEGINKRLNVLIKEVLKKESEINVIADIYVKSIDWRKSNTYELWVILNTLFPEIYPLLEKYRRCFQMITNQNVSNVSGKENNIMSFISYSTYIELKNHILWRPTYNGETQREYDVFDFLVSEIETLFFG